MRGVAAVGLVAVALLLAAEPAAANPLLGGGGAGREALGGDGGASWVAALPGPLQALMQEIARLQMQASRSMTLQLQEIRQTGGLGAAWWLVVLAFAYGVLHAAGPGHGKFVITSYFLSHRAPLLKGVLAAGAMALAQAITAIALVGGLAALLGVGRFALMQHAIYLEMASYALIAGFGLLLLVRGLRGEAVCVECGTAHGHDHHHHGHGHHAHTHDHSHAPAPRPDTGRLLGMAVAVGLRPCTGALIVLLFALANGLFPVGVLAVLAMAVGVALTTALVGLASIGVRHGLLRLIEGRPQTVALATRGLTLAGALAITGLGGLFFLATAARLA